LSFTISKDRGKLADLLAVIAKASAAKIGEDIIVSLGRCVS
jgi:hypothetical protein